ncbi:hypothetical protein D9753_09515 [Streptomyces dangxiongensis]|uniref:Uncharacterized protein n=1 Tax=Streptomyces dangxiongensis TaxID=1442032 RepID=A0A3G2JRT9_9ACTN|nr:hypothetical protein D9753_09515 [Streptomyces dangxiongensis]
MLAGGAALLLCLVLGVLYALGLPPFKDKRGEIKASEMCGTLGRSSSTAAALKRVLPDKSSYAFDGAVTDPRLDDVDSSYYASCFVNGDGKQLVAVTAEMMQYDKADEWVKDVVAENTPAGSMTPFGAGDKAVASDKVAAIYFPCVARGVGDHMSVVVHLKRPGSADGDQLRKGLISLARNAALVAHQKAKCDAPSKLTH